ncbi:hypothetical protein [Nocardioides alkalitolerans]|uniref:hypothetical protein n=1 Tax=Nocardioides alkalitolerans TaxID=281714 RepID=UPI00041E5FEF|nr:hypothetical protein [Nocardioides alkalitolerans]
MDEKGAGDEPPGARRDRARQDDAGCAVCGRKVDLRDGTAVRLFLSRGYDPREDEDLEDAYDADWVDRRTASFCSAAHATDWMRAAELADEDWVPRAEGVADEDHLGCFLGFLLLVLTGLVLVVVGLVTVVRALG